MLHRLLRVTGLLWLALIVSLALIGPALGAPDDSGAKHHSTNFFIVETYLGTAVIWFLLLCSVGLVAMIIRNVIANREGAFAPPGFVGTLEKLLEDKNYREAIELSNADPSPFAKMMHAALTQASRGYQAMEQALEESADNVGGKRVRTLVWVEVAGAAGPMCGLFGTVFGMIVTFGDMVAVEGRQPSPADLAGGISTALICTLWGLVVGIPGVIAAAIFRVRIEGLVADSIFKGQEMLGQFRPGAVKKPTPAAAGAPAPAMPKPAPTPV